jgi:hypothetical protein
MRGCSAGVYGEPMQRQQSIGWVAAGILVCAFTIGGMLLYGWAAETDSWDLTLGVISGFPAVALTGIGAWAGRAWKVRGVGPPLIFLAAMAGTAFIGVTGIGVATESTEAGLAGMIIAFVILLFGLPFIFLGMALGIASTLVWKVKTPQDRYLSGLGGRIVGYWNRVRPSERHRVRPSERTRFVIRVTILTLIVVTLWLQYKFELVR